MHLSWNGFINVPLVYLNIFWCHFLGFNFLINILFYFFLQISVWDLNSKMLSEIYKKLWLKKWWHIYDWIVVINLTNHFISIFRSVISADTQWFRETYNFCQPLKSDFTQFVSWNLPIRNNRGVCKPVNHLWWRFLANIINGLYLLTIFERSYIIDVCQGSICVPMNTYYYTVIMENMLFFLLWIWKSIVMQIILIILNTHENLLAVSNLYRDLKGMYFNVFVIYIYICMYVHYLPNLYIIVWLHNCSSLYV